MSVIPLVLRSTLHLIAALALVSCLQTADSPSSASGSGSNGGSAIESSSAGTSGRSGLSGDLGPQGGRVHCGSPKSEFQCMICNCHFETGGESYAGKLSVARVVMTRVGMSSYPNSICGVVYQPSQFSWTLVSSRRNRTLTPAEYRNCYKASVEGAKYRGHYASHFHTPAVNPRWNRNCRRKKVVGGHIFYSSCSGQSPATPAGPSSRAVAAVDLNTSLRGEKTERLYACY